MGHTSGATPLSALAHAGVPTPSACTRSSPSRTRASGSRAPARAVAGTTPEALAFATELAERLGMRPFEIDDDGRAAYHAAASMASNFLVTLEAAAEAIAAGAGLEPDDARELLMPLVRQTVENVAELGPERALTGPVARGDEATVAASARRSRRPRPSCSRCSTSWSSGRARWRRPEVAGMRTVRTVAELRELLARAPRRPPDRPRARPWATSTTATSR